MVACHHVLVKCSNSFGCAFVVVQDVAEVDVDARPPALALRHSVVPVLLRTALHHQHIAIGQFETPLGDIRADPPKRRARARPHVGHVPHFEVRGSSKGQGRNNRLRPEKDSAVCMPSDLIITVEVQPQQNGVERHLELAGHARKDGLQAGGDGLVGKAMLKTAIKVGPARCLAGIVVALALVTDSVPLRCLHYFAEEDGGVRGRKVSAKEEEIEA